MAESVEVIDAAASKELATRFPERLTEIRLPISSNLISGEIALPYSDGLVPHIGDEVILESEVNGTWQEVGRARVFQVTENNILLKRSTGDVLTAKRARILANPIHQCDLLAASPLDDRALIKGRDYAEIPINAIEVCSQASSQYGATARFHFQLGRAMDAHQQEGPAVAHYRYALAVDPQYAAAFLALGGKYMNGEGVDKNVNEAIHLLKQAHMLGLARATYLLGMIYLQGAEGLPQDIETAVGYFTTAALANDLPAQLQMAQLYDQGVGLDRDINEALNWYERAANQGHLQSQLRLADAYARGEGREQNWSRSLEWREKAALQGSAEAQVAVAGIYEHGWGLDAPELNKAMYWYRQAAEQDFALGQYHLGRMYAEGLGVEKDMETARHWLQLARAQGVREADRWLVTRKPVVAPPVVSVERKVGPRNTITRQDNLRDVKVWRLKTQGYMDAECRAELIDELKDLGIRVVTSGTEAAMTLIITMNNPEYYSSSVGPFRFTGFSIQYRAEVIRERDNIRLFYAYGKEDGDDRSESCIDAVDEIMDELDDQLD